MRSVPGPVLMPNEIDAPPDTIDLTGTLTRKYRHLRNNAVAGETDASGCTALTITGAQSRRLIGSLGHWQSATKILAIAES
jgi:hypothetical protein